MDYTSWLLFTIMCSWTYHNSDSMDVRADFENNGTTSELDEMDLLILQLREAVGTVTIDSVEEEELARKNAEVRQILSRKKNPDTTLSCVFCKKNGENKAVYSTHNVKDEMGFTTCPILQNYKCPSCGATGPKAHTIKYCPDKYANNHAPVVVKRSHNVNTMLRGWPQAVGAGRLC